MNRKVLMVTVVLGVIVGLMPAVRQHAGGDKLSMLATLSQVAPALAQEPGCEDWESGVIRAVGEAAAPDWARNPAQAEILAKEGARAMAYARLAECIAGVRVAGGTKVQKAMTADQETATVVQGVIKGARVVQEKVVTVAGAWKGVVTLAIPLQGDRGLGGQLSPRWRPSPPQPDQRLEQRPAPSRPPLTPAIDGLIVDARGLPAFPALYPQVLAEGGRVVYHWASVDREHRELVGRVTNDPEKAKTLLKEQGTANPLVVRVARMDGPTTYVIPAEEAKTVISGDLDTQFLRKSRVVFVLGL